MSEREHKPLSMSQPARAIGAPVSSCFGIVRTLEARGWYVTRSETVAEVDGERHVLIPLRANGRCAGAPRRGTPALNADGRAVLRELGFAHDDVEHILRSAAARGATGVKG